MAQNLENDRHKISASEINKFTYCNYQWYYERLYGRKKLRELNSERNKKLGLKSSTYSNFRRGTEFHNEGYRKMRMKKLFTKICILIIIVICAVLYFKVKYNV